MGVWWRRHVVQPITHTDVSFSLFSICCIPQRLIFSWRVFILLILDVLLYLHWCKEHTVHSVTSSLCIWSCSSLVVGGFVCVAVQSFIYCPFLCCHLVKALECVLWRAENRLSLEVLKLTWQSWRQGNWAKRAQSDWEERLYPYSHIT